MIFLTPVTAPVHKPVFTPLVGSLLNDGDFIEMLNPRQDDDTLSLVSEISSKSSIRRRSSTFDMEDFRTARNKNKTSGGLVEKQGKKHSEDKHHSGKKHSASKKGHRAS